MDAGDAPGRDDTLVEQSAPYARALLDTGRYPMFEWLWKVT
ncbi:hypothetical protein BJY14_004273 [Actinomadura luteofluorescens]|uniref:Uncharacterized protein n=1 Tax=Actinomadura luteofluorescens TaxID=46163 RepID=A0A7Y9EJD0_9ACTN|nr:hypothetical protein [Actinomadura luteofluorescens]NYD48290.1 hypothetical protein [Actinomadura luteofluorescens]